MQASGDLLVAESNHQLSALTSAGLSVVFDTLSLCQGHRSLQGSLVLVGQPSQLLFWLLLFPALFVQKGGESP